MMDSPVRQYQKQKDYQRHKLFRKIKRRRQAQAEAEQEAPMRALRKKLGMPSFGGGKDVNMGQKTALSNQQLKQVVANTPHEQPMSGTDPMLSWLVGGKLVGKTAGAIKNALDSYLKKAAQREYREARQKYGHDEKWSREYINDQYNDNFVLPLLRFEEKLFKFGFYEGKDKTHTTGDAVYIPEQFNSGKSGIYIKPSHRGKFTALKKRTGKSASWFKAHGTPEQKKMATFALNARKWKH